MTSREAILQSIRTANSTASQATENSAIPTYRTTSTLPHEALLHLLTDRLRDYDAHVLSTTPEALPTTIAAALKDRAATRILLPPGIPRNWLPTHLQFTEDTSLTPAQLDTFDAVLTTATLAIAQTGTIVLQNAPGQGRRALSLVPDYHLCLLRTDQIVETVPEAFAILAQTSHLPTTFISGPSATADIEMTRIKGVHGPRTLDVLLIAAASQGSS